jgi:hypothetical protein
LDEAGQQHKQGMFACRVESVCITDKGNMAEGKGRYVHYCANPQLALIIGFIFSLLFTPFTGNSAIWRSMNIVVLKK